MLLLWKASLAIVFLDLMSVVHLKSSLITLPSYLKFGICSAEVSFILTGFLLIGCFAVTSILVLFLLIVT